MELKLQINMYAYHDGGHILMNQILGITRHGSLEMKIAQRTRRSNPFAAFITLELLYHKGGDLMGSRVNPQYGQEPIMLQSLRIALILLVVLWLWMLVLVVVGAKHVYAVEASEMLAYACKLTVVTTIDHLSTKLWFESILPHLLQIRLSVEVPPAVCEDCYKRVMNEFMKQSKGNVEGVVDMIERTDEAISPLPPAGALVPLPRTAQFQGVADRVCLSLLPTSEGSSVTVARALSFDAKTDKAQLAIEIRAREKAMVVNLEFIKAIVTAEEVLLLDPLFQEVLPFVDQLRQQLPHKSVSKSQGGGQMDVQDNEMQLSSGGQWLPIPEAVEGLKCDLPFEFQVLKIALKVVCTYLDSSVAVLERNAYSVLDELVRNVSTKNFERVRSLKSNLTGLLARVQK
ncbi:unnamed protein product [Camellia sinensis]